MKSLHNIYEGILDTDFVDKLEETSFKEIVRNATTLPVVDSALNSMSNEFDKVSGTDYQDTYEKWREGKQKKMFSLFLSNNKSYLLCYTTGNTMYQMGFRYKLGSKTDGYVSFSKPSIRISALIDFIDAHPWDSEGDHEIRVKHWPWSPKFKWLSDWMYQTWKESR